MSSILPPMLTGPIGRQTNSFSSGSILTGGCAPPAETVRPRMATARRRFMAAKCSAARLAELLRRTAGRLWQMKGCPDRRADATDRRADAADRRAAPLTGERIRRADVGM